MTEYHYEIWQNDIAVVEGSGSDLDAVRRDMLHYAMIYLQDGPIQIRGHPALGPTAHTEEKI
jgi:hypothetical protein